MQFGNFLATHLSADEYQRRMPNLQELSESYHLLPDVAFFLTRPMLPHSISVSGDCYLVDIKVHLLRMSRGQVKFDELKEAGGGDKNTKTKDAVNKVGLSGLCL